MCCSVRCQFGSSSAISLQQTVAVLSISLLKSAMALQPQPGWIVRAFHYWQYGSSSWSSIYLACGAGAHSELHSIQLWWPGANPTGYHGDWHQELLLLHLSVNGRGLGSVSQPRLVHDAYLFRTKHTPTVYEGWDYRGRKIRMEHDGTWELQAGGIYWQQLAEGTVVPLQSVRVSQALRARARSVAGLSSEP